MDPNTRQVKLEDFKVSSKTTQSVIPSGSSVREKPPCAFTHCNPPGHLVSQGHSRWSSCISCSYPQSQLGHLQPTQVLPEQMKLQSKLGFIWNNSSSKTVHE